MTSPHHETHQARVEKQSLCVTLHIHNGKRNHPKHQENQYAVVCNPAEGASEQDTRPTRPTGVAHSHAELSARGAGERAWSRPLCSLIG